MSPWVRVLAVLVVLGAAASTGWVSRGWKDGRDYASERETERQQGIAAQAKITAKVSQIDTAAKKNTTQSTQRLDAAEPARAKEIQYVTRDVIKYRDRSVAGKCTLPVEWVRIYNASGAGYAAGSPAVPEAAKP